MAVCFEKVFVVTGASSGVGRAVAIALAEAGASVALVGRDESTLHAVASMVPGRMKSFVVDLLGVDGFSMLKHAVLEDFGRVDGLVHSAGIFMMGRVEDARLEDFDLQYQVNVRAPFALTQLFLPSLIERRGDVVFINSTAGLNAAGGVSQYAATKHALKAMADSLRQEVNSRGVRVLSIYLGRTATPMQEAICKAEGKIYDADAFIQPDDVANTLVQAISLPRTAELVDLTVRPMRKL